MNWQEYLDRAAFLAASFAILYFFLSAGGF